MTQKSTKFYIELIVMNSIVIALLCGVFTLFPKAPEWLIGIPALLLWSYGWAKVADRSNAFYQRKNGTNYVVFRKDEPDK